MILASKENETTTKDSAKSRKLLGYFKSVIDLVVHVRAVDLQSMVVLIYVPCTVHDNT